MCCVAASELNWPPTSLLSPAARCPPRCSCCARRADAHPQGLGNGSGQVGRNYMRHNNSTMLAVSRRRNETRFQKTLGLNDFYDGADDYEFPLGHIQMVGKLDGVQIRGAGLPNWLHWAPLAPFQAMADHSLELLADKRRRSVAGQPYLLRERRSPARSQLRRIWRRIGDCARNCGTMRAGSAAGSIAASFFRKTSVSTAPRIKPARCALACRSRDECARHRLQGARSRQSLCMRRELLSVDRRGEPDADDHRERLARGGSHFETIVVTSSLDLDQMTIRVFKQASLAQEPSRQCASRRSRKSTGSPRGFAPT